MLSQKTLLILRQYFKEYKPKEWLFEGEGGGQYADRSIQNILKKAVQNVGIKKRITVHTLRHSAVYPALAGQLIYWRMELTFGIYNRYLDIRVVRRLKPKNEVHEHQSKNKNL